MGSVVPLAEDDVTLKIVRTHASLLPESLLDEHTGDSRREHAKHTDAKEHENDADRPSAERRGKNVPKTDCGQRDGGPPQSVGDASIVLEVGQTARAANDQQCNDTQQAEQILAVQELPEHKQPIGHPRLELEHVRVNGLVSKPGREQEPGQMLQVSSCW